MAKTLDRIQSESVKEVDVEQFNEELLDMVLEFGEPILMELDWAKWIERSYSAR